MRINIMSIGVIRFPGSNCDRDVYHAIELAGGNPEYIWWNKENISDLDAVVIPGGFSYGDYLRAGAIASNTPDLGCRLFVYFLFYAFAYLQGLLYPCNALSLNAYL